MVGNLPRWRIEFNTYRASAKVTRVLRDGRASCLVVPRERRGQVATLWVRGAASIVTEPRGSTPALAAGVSRTEAKKLVVPGDVVANVARSLQDGKRCLLRVEVTEIRWIGEGPARS